MFLDQDRNEIVNGSFIMGHPLDTEFSMKFTFVWYSII